VEAAKEKSEMDKTLAPVVAAANNALGQKFEFIGLEFGVELNHKIIEGPRDPRLHRGMPEHPAVVICLHESLILLIGDEHGPAKRPDPTDLADQPPPQIPGKFQGSAVVVSR
jgi:hypothetical protein